MIGTKTENAPGSALLRKGFCLGRFCVTEASHRVLSRMTLI